MAQPSADAPQESLVQFRVVVFLVSTTGQGEQPSNARGFWKRLLRKKLGPTSLRPLRFAIFGLGDSSYPNYNWAALKLRKRLLQLGASEVVEFGKGDEQHQEGHDGTFVPWVQALRATVLETFPLGAGQEPIPDDVLLQPRMLLSTSSGDSSAQPQAAQHAAIGQDAQLIDVSLVENKRVTPSEHWQDVRHMKFISSQSIPYGPGDVLVIYPENAAEDVTEMLDLMGWQDVADVPMSLEPNPRHPASAKSTFGPASNGPHPPRMTLRDWLTKRLDLNAVPRRAFFGLLAHFTTDEYQRSRLVEFTQPEYLDELYDYTTRPRRSVLEVLQEFHTVRIPWTWAAVVLPPLRGRQFSLASGGALKRRPAGGTAFELLVAIVEYRTVIRRIRRGICTRYLSALPVGAELKVSLERRGLGFGDMDRVRPMVMIGPGTGVAPLRSLIWERSGRRAQQHIAMNGLLNGASPANEKDQEVLFFGCRNQGADYFFRDEWEQLNKTAPLAVFPAFSRDQLGKVYVQDMLRLHSALVYRLLHHLDGIVYVCGASGQMPRAVREALIEVFEKEGAMARSDAEVALREMEKSGSYKQVCKIVPC